LEAVPWEFKLVKYCGEGAAGDLRDQILWEYASLGMRVGKSSCFWEACSHLT